MSQDESAFALLKELCRLLSGRLKEELLKYEADLLDPAQQPVRHALVCVFIVRLRAYVEQLDLSIAADDKRLLTPPRASEPFGEIERWVTSETDYPERRIFTEEFENANGDLLVKMGYSYTETKEQLRLIKRVMVGRGAPSKRTETVKMLDARIVNGWSYSRLATEMCDCGKIRHSTQCAERIRKRIKELEDFLNKRQIAYRKPKNAPGDN